MSITVRCKRHGEQEATCSLCAVLPNGGKATNPDDNECQRKAYLRGDETFTLVGQDQSSPRVIAFWILENIETCPPQKLVAALNDAIRMRGLPRRKTAD